MAIMTDKEREAEVARLRAVLQKGKFTVVEMASIRGRIGGLVGAGHPGRRLGGIRGAEARWGKTRKSSDRRKDPASPRDKRKK
jgi:hypothetical protein